MMTTSVGSIRRIGTDSLTLFIKRRSSTVSSEEVDKFRVLAQHWWDPNGEFKALHSLNRLRIRLIEDGLINSGRLKVLELPKPLKGLDLLDIGCGGGILSEPLARLGARVVGIDAVEESIAIAKAHQEDNLKINYICSTVERFAEENPESTFDAVVMSEVIEHVENPEFFISIAAKLLKPNGSMFITTINRTRESWAAAIIMAEYVLNLVPRGTHQWQKFLTPEELHNMLSKSQMEKRLIHGMCYNPVNNHWSWTARNAVNYAIHSVKSG